jgi:effector-binding domain-containing protein
MRFMDLILLSSFMQVLNSIRKHSTKDEYFPKHILFTTIYSLQEQKLNPNKYCEQQIKMSNFVQATEHDVHMYAKFGCLDFYGVL